MQKQNPVPFRKKKNRQQKSFQKKENTDQIHGKNLLIKKRSVAMEEMEKSHRSQGTAGRLSVPRVPLPGRKGSRYCFSFCFSRNSKSCRECCNKNSRNSSRIYGCWSGCTGRKKNGRKFQRNAATEKYSNRKPEDKDADKIIPAHRRK